MRIRVVSILMTLIFLSACASTPAAVREGAAEVPSTFEVEDYRLGPGDRVRLSIFNEPELSGDFAVDGSGSVALPLIGEVKARGMTVREFEGAVETAFLDGYLKDPRVSAEVVSYRPFYILGEVKRPGTYPYQNGLTVLNAVATAEGFTYRARKGVVFIRRAGATEELKFPLTSSTPVMPGDTIRIEERYF